MLHEDAIGWARERMPHPGYRVRGGRQICPRCATGTELPGSRCLGHGQHMRVYGGGAGGTDRQGVRHAKYCRKKPPKQRWRGSYNYAGNTPEMLFVYSAKFFLDGVLETGRL
jgi:hypothetical protein